MTEIAAVRHGPRVEVRAGFFWMPNDGSATISIENFTDDVQRVAFTIADCVVVERPRWYQLGQWWRAFHLWRTLGR